MAAWWIGGIRVLGVVAGMSGAAPFAMAEETPFKMPTFSAKDMVPQVHGPNWVDLDGDGHKYLVMKLRYNAPYPSPHSASTYTFSIWGVEEPVFLCADSLAEVSLEFSHL
ncbi:MAG: hypothetical protein H7Z12_03060 [Rhodospirillaceae bacterium]|nr:hypothetical protein [Rhodospirillales bacterium]